MWTVPGLPPLEVARRWRVMGGLRGNIFLSCGAAALGKAYSGGQYPVILWPRAQRRHQGTGFYSRQSPVRDRTFIYIFLLSLLSFAGEWVIRRQGGAWLRVQARGEA